MRKLLLTGAMLGAFYFNANAQEQIITSFESSEDLGYILGADVSEYATLWGTFNTVTSDVVDSGLIIIGDQFPTEGTQSLYFPAGMIGTEDGESVNYAFTTLLNFATFPAPYSLGFDATTNEISTSGSNFYAEFYSYDSDTEATNAIASVMFNYDGTLYVGNYETLEYEEVGEFTAEEASNVKFRVNGDDTVTVVVAGEDVVTYPLDASYFTGVYYAAFGADDWGSDYSVDRITVSEETAAVKNNTRSEFSVYPNPASNVVNVSNIDALVNNVALTDLNGRTVKTVKFNGVSDAQVNIADLASGVYLMTISSDRGTTSKKVVKE